MKYLIQAREIMETAYIVEAVDADAARAMVETIDSAPDAVEQIDAYVWEVQVQSVDRVRNGV